MRKDNKTLNIDFPEEITQKAPVPFQDELKFNTEREFPQFSLKQ